MCKSARPSVAGEVNRSVDLAAIHLKTFKEQRRSGFVESSRLEMTRLERPDQIMPLYSIFYTCVKIETRYPHEITAI